MNVLTTNNLTVGYRKKKRVFAVQQNLQLTLQKGELVCLIGQNGVGKSTLIKTVAGLLKPLEGNIFIENKEISQFSSAQKAKKISLVLTDKIEIENATVYDIVSYGRHPYTDRWGNLLDSDKEKISEALNLVHLNNKKDEPFSELSDGEKQRVMIAKALAQDTEIIILDEPTAHLDLPNRVEIMLLLHSLAHRSSKAILLSTHELDLALQAADRIWLMGNEKVENGVPEDLVLNGNFERAFDSKHYFFNSANGNFSMNYNLTKTVGIQGDKTRMYWTLRALARAGYKTEENSDVMINVSKTDWTVNSHSFNSIESLLNFLNNVI